MGVYNKATVRKLVSHFLICSLSRKYDKINTELSKDNGLTATKNKTNPWTEKTGIETHEITI